MAKWWFQRGQSSENGRDVLQISVIDNGPGIPEEHIEHVFDRYYQVDPSKADVQGSGIGLSLVHEFVTLLNGTIEVESSEGSGTAFHVRLPVSHNARENHVIGGEIVARSTITHTRSCLDDAGLHGSTIPDGTRYTLLIVEDNLDVIQYVRAVLSSRFRIEMANDGAAGIEKAKALVPDLIISDIMMPVMDGIEMCQSPEKRTSSPVTFQFSC